MLWLTWQLAIATGLTVGSVLPPSLDLDFIVPLYTIALVVPQATTGPVRAGAAVGAAAAVAATLLPGHVGPTAGIIAGVAAALIYRRTAA